MMKALYSGVSGMRSHQTKMDVIGNNIANVNTNGYKSQRATFRDIYYQTMKSPNEATASTRGGTNASQVGYGAQIGSIDTIHTLSGYSPTNKSTDLYINGEGFFIVKNASNEQFLTRYGAFNFDSKGNLVDSSGSLVMGWNATFSHATAGTSVQTANPNPSTGTLSPINIPFLNESFKNITINADGTISAVGMVGANLDKVVTIGQVAVASVPNPEALVLEGNSYFSVGNNAGIPTYEVPGINGTGALVSGGLEMSNVDLANEFSDMIVTQRGFQANTKIISVVDQMLEELVNLKR